MGLFSKNKNKVPPAPARVAEPVRQAEPVKAAAPVAAAAAAPVEAKPAAVEPAAIQANVDLFDADRVVGWAIDPGAQTDRVTIKVLSGGRELGAAIANILRDDLLAAGLGDGKCSFEVRYARPILPGERLVVVATSHGREQQLAEKVF